MMGLMTLLLLWIIQVVVQLYLSARCLYLATSVISGGPAITTPCPGTGTALSTAVSTGFKGQLKQDVGLSQKFARSFGGSPRPIPTFILHRFERDFHRSRPYDPNNWGSPQVQ